MLKTTDLKAGDSILYMQEKYNLTCIQGQYMFLTHLTDKPITLSIQQVTSAIRSNSLKMAPISEQANKAPLGNLKSRQDALVIMKYVEYFENKKGITNEMIDAASKKLSLPPIKKTCLYDNRKKARKFGMIIDSFLPQHHKKGSKTPRYTVQLEFEAENFIRKNYLNRDVKTMTSVHNRFRGYCSIKLGFSEKEIPSLQWLRRQLDKFPKTEIILKRKGSTALKQSLRKYNKKFRVEEILDRVEFDFFSPKVLFRSKDGKEVISRVYFCIVIDVYSKLPLAVTTLEERGESADCFKACLKQAITEPLYSTRSNTEIPCTGLMRTLVVDAGAGFSKEELIAVITYHLGIVYQTTEVAAPYRKPYIENLVYQIKLQFEPLMPGHYDNIREDCDDQLSRPINTVEQYKEELINWFVDVYAKQRQLGDTKSPLELWQESYARIGTSIPVDIDSRFALSGELISGQASYRKGIYKHGLYYRNDELSELVGVGRTITLEYYVDPMDISAIHVVHPKEKYLIKVEPAHHSIPSGTTLEELKSTNQFKKPKKSIERCEAEYLASKDLHNKAKSIRSENPKRTRKTDTSTISVADLNNEFLNQIVNTGTQENDELIHTPLNDNDKLVNKSLTTNTMTTIKRKKRS